MSYLLQLKRAFVTLCILDSEKLADLSSAPVRAPRATVSMTPQGERAYLTVVMADIDSAVFCLYAEIHAAPRVPAEVEEAVAAFNADASEWNRLVAESLDAEEVLLAENRDSIAERAARTQETRLRLLADIE